MKQRKTTEHYLKAIYVLSQNGAVHGAQIAAMLNVSRPSVSIALRELEEEGYLVLDHNKAVYMLRSGWEVGSTTYKRCRFFEKALLRLGVSEENAKHDACELEHCVSDESFRAIQKALNDKFQIEEEPLC